MLLKLRVFWNVMQVLIQGAQNIYLVVMVVLAAIEAK
jgi:hypothetical protein